MSKKEDPKKGIQPAYPVQPTAPYPVMQGPPLHPMGAPPSYSAIHPMPSYVQGGAVPQALQGYPQQTQPYPMQTYPYPPQMQPNYSYGPLPGPSYMPAQPQTVFVPGLFDAGARFNQGASASIPPPPPGVAPNAAQMALMQGYTVAGTKKEANFFIDGSGGGTTLW